MDERSPQDGPLQLSHVMAQNVLGPGRNLRPLPPVEG